MKGSSQLVLELLPDQYAVVRLGPEEQIPAWSSSSDFLSLTRTKEELSVVCLERLVPHRTRAQGGFRCIKIRGPLDFSEVGVLLSVAQPLAENGVSLLALSTYDTDYFLVPESDLEEATNALAEAGHTIRPSPEEQ